MAEVTKRCAVEPINSSLELNETLARDVDLTDRRNRRRSSSSGGDRSCVSRIIDWFASMSFDDNRLELMYDRYVVKFSEYRVNMLMLLLSLCCLVELIFYFVVDVNIDHIVTVVLAMTMLLVLIFTQVNLNNLL